MHSLEEFEIIILAHPDIKKRVDVFALSINGLVVFPKALGHIDETVIDLFDRLDKRVTPVPTILEETFKSLNACQREGEVFSKNYSPPKEIVATPRRDDISEEKWMAILQNLCKEDVEWRAPWLLPYEILYRCGDFDWIPLLRIWRAVGYAPLLVLRRNAELEKKIEQIEEEKMNLRLDVDVQKLEAERLRKRKNKAKDDLDSLKTYYKKLRLSMRTIGLEKTSE
ncbi:hypothetical protein Goari_000068 [Gossypium aridum]|uniref:DUF7745 domain-containing protein n=2 Tax=Gossypium aridum TaxID=34290 RepID=A0A7J8YT16_GOSAI|nr:hypothetical protein [Gossypium aridum]